MSNDWDEDHQADDVPRCRICERPTECDLCPDCEWHTKDEES